VTQQQVAGLLGDSPVHASVPAAHEGEDVAGKRGADVGGEHQGSEEAGISDQSCLATREHCDKQQGPLQAGDALGRCTSGRGGIILRTTSGSRLKLAGQGSRRRQLSRSSSARSASSSGGQAWRRPGGTRTSARDDGRKLQSSESARRLWRADGNQQQRCAAGEGGALPWAASPRLPACGSSAAPPLEGGPADVPASAQNSMQPASTVLYVASVCPEAGRQPGCCIAPAAPSTSTQSFSCTGTPHAAGTAARTSPDANMPGNSGDASLRQSGQQQVMQLPQVM